MKTKQYHPIVSLVPKLWQWNKNVTCVTKVTLAHRTLECINSQNIKWSVSNVCSVTSLTKDHKVYPTIKELCMRGWWSSVINVTTRRRINRTWNRTSDQCMVMKCCSAKCVTSNLPLKAQCGPIRNEPMRTRNMTAITVTLQYLNITY